MFIDFFACFHTLNAISILAFQMLEEELPLNLESLVDSHKNDWNKVSLFLHCLLTLIFSDSIISAPDDVS